MQIYFHSLLLLHGVVPNYGKGERCFFILQYLKSEEIAFCFITTCTLTQRNAVHRNTFGIYTHEQLCYISVRQGQFDTFHTEISAIRGEGAPREALTTQFRASARYASAGLQCCLLAKRSATL